MLTKAARKRVCARAELQCAFQARCVSLRSIFTVHTGVPFLSPEDTWYLELQTKLPPEWGLQKNRAQNSKSLWREIPRLSRAIV